MLPRCDIPDRLTAILKSIAMVAQQHVLQERTAALSRPDAAEARPTVPLNRAPLNAWQASASEP